MIDFDEAAHRYSMAGVTVPSVTQILDAMGQISDFCKSTQASERGSRVHEACAMLARGVLDWSTVDPRVLGYVLSYQEYLGACSGWRGPTAEWTLKAVEQRVYSPNGYAGTYDALFGGWLLDLKTGGPAKWHALQTAAYHHAARCDFRVKRATVYLNGEGKLPKFVEHKDRTDLPEFLTLVEGYHNERS